MGITKKCSCTGKNLDRFMQATILMLLSEEEMHGFVMLQKIGKTPMFYDALPDASGLYRYLKKMEGQGLLISREEQQEDLPSKKIYSITEEGRTCLKNWKATIRDYVKNLLDFLEVLNEKAVTLD